MSKTPTRREYLAATVAGGTAAVVGAAPTAAQAQTFELALTSEGWVGRAPDAIDGTVNPTLEVEVDTEYAIRWTNQTDEMHNLVIMDEDRSDIVRSDFLMEKGESQTVRFTATADLSSYFSEMVLEEGGEFSVQGVETPTATATATPEPTSTPTESPEPTEPPDGDATSTATETTDGSGAGFGVAAALAAAGSLAVRAVTRDE